MIGRWEGEGGATPMHVNGHLKGLNLIGHRPGKIIVNTLVSLINTVLLKLLLFRRPIRHALSVYPHREVYYSSVDLDIPL